MRYKINNICFGSLARAKEFKQLDEDAGIEVCEDE